LRGRLIEYALEPVLIVGKVVLILDQFIDEAIEVEFFKETLRVHVFLVMGALLIMTPRSIPYVI
jgi:hypothetical protein